MLCIHIIIHRNKVRTDNKKIVSLRHKVSIANKKIVSLINQIALIYLSIRLAVDAFNHKTKANELVNCLTTRVIVRSSLNLTVMYLITRLRDAFNHEIK